MNSGTDEAPTEHPNNDAYAFYWEAGAHLLLALLAFAILQFWVSFDASECPKKQ
jgi:hypothetical protein